MQTAVTGRGQTVIPASIRQNAMLLHKDLEFEALDGQLSLEALPYKGALSPS
jgi:bifunctional DNA-binding transcriptional regulator/antitoxin component of YhaV-PrlF toxin-antitoxin module